MKCPHCREGFHDTWQWSGLGQDVDGIKGVRKTNCPACGRDVIELVHYSGAVIWGQMQAPTAILSKSMIHPKTFSRAPLAPEVPASLAAYYREACLVLSDSPMASAALSRRCLQALLRNHAGIKPSDLSNEIQQVLDKGNLPSHVADEIDAIRAVGNFAAHEIKSTNTGAIVEVEVGEAEWNLDTLEALFDIYFVQPSKVAARKAALNQKLAAVNKPPLK